MLFTLIIANKLKKWKAILFQWEVNRTVCVKVKKKIPFKFQIKYQNITGGKVYHNFFFLKEKIINGVKWF